MKSTIFEHTKRQRILRTLIIDDAPHVRETLRHLPEKFFLWWKPETSLRIDDAAR
jgi:hypothetical protein